MTPKTKVRRTTEWYRADELYIDPTVQRKLKPAKVRKLCETLDLDGIGVATVNVRDDGTKSLVDAQHRRAALLELDMGEWKIKCDTYWGLSVGDEHRLWRRLSDGERTMTAIWNGLDGPSKTIIVEPIESPALPPAPTVEPEREEERTPA